MFLGNKLALVLKERGLTHTAFAQKVGVNKSAFSKLITGKRRPTLSEAYRISLELSLPIEFFLKQGMPFHSSPRIEDQRLALLSLVNIIQQASSDLRALLEKSV